MSAYLDLDDAAGPHPQAAAELAALRAELDTVYSIAHRLALDLECVLLATDNPAATKWWNESCETLQSWRDFVEKAKRSRHEHTR